MLQHCLTKDNLNAAQSNAETQVLNLFNSLGYKKVILHFE